jgi:hypothetical protein
VKRWPWTTLFSFVVGVLIWHGIFRMPRPDPAPDSQEPALQPAAAGEFEPEAPVDTLEAREDELAFMQRLRESQEPALALELAREGNRRFPTGSGAAERAAIIARSLAKLGRAAEARAQAERLVHDYPDTPWAQEVEAHTGAATKTP